MKINDYAFDTYAKELVRITNGIEKDGVFEPTEAIALRCLGYKDGQAVTGWTYRKVEAVHLVPVIPDRSAFDFPARRGKYFIGRI